MSTLDERLQQDNDLLPTCLDYAGLLQRIVKKKKISMDDARMKYGNFTYKQWKEVLDGC